ncbi:MAG: hypothetical protein NT079_03100 [Candidatus Omnitrophica bacterium]|nr:hypothetical protein [Candidatus Omnitrophota bacterium]
MKKIFITYFIILMSLNFLGQGIAFAQEEQYSVFNDKDLLGGYAKQYAEESKEVLVAMINDDTLPPYRMAAAIRVFNEKFGQVVFSKEKILIEKALLRRMALTTSVFVDTEIRHTLCKMDRYKYFESMVPKLLYRLDHYNKVVNELAYGYINDIIQTGQDRTREARIVFETLRKMLFLSRKKINDMTQADERLKQKIELSRWAIKILGNQELQRLPPEAIHLF